MTGRGCRGRAAAPVPLNTSPSAAGWSGGRVTAVVLGSLLAVTALGLAISGAVLMAADRGGRDADGFVTTGPMNASTPGYAMVVDPVELQSEPGAPALGAMLGDVRVSAVGTDTAALFVGIGPAADVEAYLAGVERSRLTGGSTAAQVLPGGAPATPPAQQGVLGGDRRRAGSAAADVDRLGRAVGRRRDERRREPCRHGRADRGCDGARAARALDRTARRRRGRPPRRRAARRPRHTAGVRGAGVPGS